MNSPMPTENARPEGIAVIGMAGRFPGAKDVRQFWQNLVAGVDSISRFRDDELEYNVANEAGQPAGQKYVNVRGVLENVDLFDAAHFDINPHEAELMDPQHRFFLECAWEALEGAGYDSERYPGLIGVFAGCSVNSYLLYNLCKDRAFAARFAGNYQVDNFSTLLGNDKDFLATRVSYKLNLKGPSMAIQTACSTALVAICQACTNLLTYQCDMALSGGVSISVPQKRNYRYEEGNLVSSDGICRTFDAAADGTVFGNGIAVVLLKRLADAMADGDNVLAVIKGFATNNDGAQKVGYAAPSVEAQANVIAMAQAAAGVDPESISYIEAHGTGTALGDPIEVAALTKAFREGGATRKQYCPIGSAKPNIGHLDGAAGVTGLIKTILQLQHSWLPSLLHFSSPNKNIAFSESPFFPVTHGMEWKRGNGPRRAGVSAFGVGGTNAHVIVEEAPPIEAGGISRPQQLLLLSAKSETALNKMSENLAAHLLDHPQTNLGDAAFTLSMGRRPFAFRRAMIAGSVADAAARLRAGDNKSVINGKAAQTNLPVVFVFPGQGSQFVGMGRGLYKSEPVFRMAIDRCAGVLKEHLHLDIRSILYPDSDGRERERAEAQLNQTSVTQPAIFTIEFALAQLWLSWGVKPAALIGHSIGEYVAAVLAGVFTLEDALRLLSVRARLMGALPGGAMLAVRLEGKTVETMLPPGAALAAFNSARNCTISGPEETLKALQQELEARKVPSRFLATSHAFHSAMMEPMLQEFLDAVRITPWSEPKIPWISTCTGSWIKVEDLTDPSYWGRQLRFAVRFADGFDLIMKDAPKVILEVGPGQALTQLVSQHPEKSGLSVVCSSLNQSTEPLGEQAFILQSLGKLWAAGVNPDWQGFYAKENRRRIPLPTYPFERKRYWIEPAQQQLDSSSAELNGIGSGRGGFLSADLDTVKAEAGPVSLEQAIFDQLTQMNEQLDRLQTK